jgi:deoxyhypusine synthase
MADLAKGAVFMKSEGLRGDEKLVRGVVSDSYSTEERVRQLPQVVSGLATTGFQATNFGNAVAIAESFVAQRFARHPPEVSEDPDLVTAQRPPIELYMGLTANLLGTGVRESVRFLVKHRLVDHLVITGGGVEHDIRRAVSPSSYVVEGGSASLGSQGAAASSWPRFGNIRYDKHNAEFERVLINILRELSVEQTSAREECERKPIPSMYDDVCRWAMGPSDIWREVGLRLPRHTSRAVAESSVVYWAAVNEIPIYSPSFTDGDVMEILLAHGVALKLDLVGDIHRLNKSAMSAKKTMMMILGGGVAKHHVCNANLMRNGADLSIFINNAQEYDGSDAGARPDEAVSWGKIRLDGESVKIYAEITLVFPLLVAHAILPGLRQHLQQQQSLATTAEVPQ